MFLKSPFLFGSDADRAPQLKANVGLLVVLTGVRKRASASAESIKHII
jgi:hypothetical protein